MMRPRILMADDHAMLLTGDALRLGATGVVLKSSAFQELKQAIHEVLRGRSYITPIVTRDVVGALIEDKTSRHELTMCQREVLQLLAEGAREGDRCHP